MGDKGALGPSPRVLVIEDDMSVREVLAELLTEIVGHPAAFAAHLGQLTPDLSPDLVISDLVGLRPYRADAGIAYLEELRARFPAAKILLLSAQAWIRTNTRTLPVDDWIAKPFDVVDFSDRIRALCPSEVASGSAA